MRGGRQKRWRVRWALSCSIAMALVASTGCGDSTGGSEDVECELDGEICWSLQAAPGLRGAGLIVNECDVPVVVDWCIVPFGEICDPEEDGDTETIGSGEATDPFRWDFIAETVHVECEKF